jgi:hypothetical protein
VLTLPPATPALIPPSAAPLAMERSPAPTTSVAVQPETPHAEQPPRHFQRRAKPAALHGYVWSPEEGRLVPSGATSTDTGI